MSDQTSDHQEKLDAAQEELAQTGIWKSNWHPPYMAAYKAFGRNPRPPHYLPFWTAALGQGTFFTLFWGGLMYFIEWRASGMPLIGMVLSALFAGATFGLLMALYYRHGRRKHGLTEWDDL